MKTLGPISALLASYALLAGTAWDDSELIKARDRQDRSAIEKIAGELRAAAEKDPNDAAGQYRLALAESYSAEVAIEMRDKAPAKNGAPPPTVGSAKTGRPSPTGPASAPPPRWW